MRCRTQTARKVRVPSPAGRHRRGGGLSTAPDAARNGSETPNLDRAGATPDGGPTRERAAAAARADVLRLAVEWANAVEGGRERRLCDALRDAVHEWIAATRPPAAHRRRGTAGRPRPREGAAT